MPGGDLSGSGYILLGMLTSRDWSAYQLAEQLGRGLDQIWPRATRQRYKTLRELKDRGLVTTRDEESGKRTRTVYSITDAGRAALAQWFPTPTQPTSLESEGMLRVLLGEQGSLEDLTATLTRMRDDAVAQRDSFLAQIDHVEDTGGLFPQRRHLAALTYGFLVGHHEHIAAWAEAALAEVATWPDIDSPARDEALTARLFAHGRAAASGTPSPDI